MFEKTTCHGPRMRATQVTPHKCSAHFTLLVLLQAMHRAIAAHDKLDSSILAAVRWACASRGCRCSRARAGNLQFGLSATGLRRRYRQCAGDPAGETLFAIKMVLNHAK